MKKIIKKIIGYDKFYNIIKGSFLYQAWKKINWKIAVAINWNPAKDFFIVWVTWTNGKTTTVNMLHQLFNDLVAPTVMISTACIKIWNQASINDKKMTSLDVYQLQWILADAKSQWCKIAILEASSQWLDQNRFEWIKFDYAVLTNITRDHLDYHKNMDDYALAKKKLFKYVLSNWKNTKYATFPADDKIWREWNNELAFDKKVTFWLQSSATLKAENIVDWKNDTTFDIIYLGQRYPTKTYLLWNYNIYNYLAALSVWIQIWLDIKDCINSLSQFTWVSGRMEKVEHNWITYFIDFAHDPDALDKTLRFLYRLKWDNKLILVFWAPWNRDKEKRPEMGRLWGKFADVVIATDDDPDSENRLDILKQLTQDIWRDETMKKKLHIIPERYLAIKFATQIAKPWDIVMLAWKWHEPIQRTNFWTRKRNDKEKLLEIINN
jgi:UDP-N-acetylmuramoyl-L-alanyl-D-glutamate--2,6-diaminopimelate ligase